MRVGIFSDVLAASSLCLLCSIGWEKKTTTFWEINRAAKFSADYCQYHSLGNTFLFLACCHRAISQRVKELPADGQWEVNWGGFPTRCWKLPFSFLLPSLSRWWKHASEPSYLPVTPYPSLAPSLPPPVFLLSEIHQYTLSHKGGKVSLWKQGGEISKSYLLRRELRQQKVWVAVKQPYTRSMYSSFSSLFGSLDVGVNTPPPCQPATTFLPLPACVSACRHLPPLCWKSETLCSLKCMALLGQLCVCVCGIYFIYLFIF